MVEYSYFIALEPSPKFVAGVTAATTAPEEKLLDACGGNRPQWFLPKSLASYEAGSVVMAFGKEANNSLNSPFHNAIGKNAEKESNLCIIYLDSATSRNQVSLIIGGDS